MHHQPENLYVLNANSGEKIRTVKIQCSSRFSNLSLLSNRDFLFVCEKLETGNDIFMYSCAELIDSSISDEQLWTRVLAISDWYEVAVNKNSLVSGDDYGGVLVHKFWDDRVYSYEDSDEDRDEDSDEDSDEISDEDIDKDIGEECDDDSNRISIVKDLDQDL